MEIPPLLSPWIRDTNNTDKAGPPHTATMDLDDFRIPDTPQLALSADSLPAPRSAPSSSGITGLGLNAQHASSKRFIASRSRPRELEVETQVGPDTDGKLLYTVLCYLYPID